MRVVKQGLRLFEIVHEWHHCYEQDHAIAYKYRHVRELVHVFNQRVFWLKRGEDLKERLAKEHKAVSPSDPTQTRFCALVINRDLASILKMPFYPSKHVGKACHRLTKERSVNWNVEHNVRVSQVVIKKSVWSMF